MKTLKRAWWWLADYAYATSWQVRAAVGRTRSADFASGDGRPVVIIPGIYETWQFLRPLIDRLHGAGHPVHVITVLAHNRLPVEHGARLVSDYILATGLQDAAIVAHSKGGLIGKLVMLRPDAGARVSMMATVCTPFSGSRYARYLLLPSLRAFSPRNATTGMLAREEAVNARITSIFGVFDPHIPEGSELVGATNLRLPVGGHFRILSDERCIEAVLAAVRGHAL